MDRKFIITTESTSDFASDYCVDKDIIEFPLFYYVNDVAYGGNTGKTMPNGIFYEEMRNDAKVSTAATAPESLKETFTKKVEEGFDILHIAFSSALSASCNNANFVAQEVMEDHPGSRIVVVDSLAASAGQGLLVDYAYRMREDGKSLDEVAAWVEENRVNLVHEFTVEDLKYLRKGGRISKTVAIVGTIINVKPVLHVDNNGCLVPLSKVRGRKKALLTLVNDMEAKFIKGVTNKIFISHGDSIEDAKFVGNLIKERYGITDITYSYISPTIGSHAGPGTIALFYLGKNRDE